MTTSELKLPRTVDELAAIMNDKDQVSAWNSADLFGELVLHGITLKAEDMQAEQFAAARNAGGTGAVNRLNLAPGPGAWNGRNGLPALAPSADVTSQLYEAAMAKGSLRIKNAVITTTETGGVDHSVPLESNLREPRRIVAAAGITAQGVDGVTSTDFPVFGAGDAGITGEGSGKTEYDGITAGTATPQMITIYTDTTRQQVLTQPNFEATLRSVLAAKVARREDVLMVARVLATTGIQTLDSAGTLTPDLVLEAAAEVAAGDVAAEPNLFAFHPDDTATLFGADAFNSNAVTDSRALDFRLHGMFGYPTSAITAGEVLVGAWPAASRFIVGLDPMFLVDAVSGLKTNVITMLLEEAVSLAVDEPTGFCHIEDQT